MKFLTAIILPLFFTSFLLAQINGNALILNGVNDYIEVPNNNSTDFINTMTVECWVNLACGVDGYQAIVNKQWCAGEDFAYALGVRDGAVEWTWVNQTIVSCAASNTYKSSNIVIPFNEWTHISVTHTSSEVNLYVNGSLVNGFLNNGIYGTINVSSQPLKMGVYRFQGGDYGRYLKGGLDEVRIWDYTRTADEISNDYNQILSGNESGLVSYYNMEDIEEMGIGFTLPNQAISTGNMNDGVSIGTPTTPYFISTDESLFFLGDNIETTIDIEICEGESYFAEGSEQTMAGTYVDTYPLTNGCDSIVYTNLTIINEPSICSNEGDIIVTVWEDADGDGIFDDDESTVDNIEVLLFDEDGNLVVSGVTIVICIFEGVPNGTYIATINIGDAENTTAESVIVTVDGENIEIFFGIMTPVDCESNAGDLSLISNPVLCQGESLVANSVNFTAEPDYEQAYLLTDENGVIQAVNNNGTFSMPIGNYIVYGANYLSTETSLPTVGQNLSDWTNLETCNAITEGITVTFVADIDITIEIIQCNEITGVYDLAVSFSGGLPVFNPVAIYSVTGDLTGTFSFGENAIINANENSTFSISVNDGFCTATESIILENCTKTNVEWLYFEGVIKDEKTKLRWGTASEINSDYFNIQKSQDGINFQTIGKIKANETSNTQQDYIFIDKEKKDKLIYYRLEEVDLDGQKKWSKIIAISYTTPQDIRLYPNPVSNILNIELDNTFGQNVIVKIFNSNGQIILEKPEITTETSIIQLDTHELQTGVLYFIEIINKNKEGIISSFIKY